MAKLKAPFALDRSLNTTEQTSRNIADVLAEELSAIITALGGLNFINYEVVEELPTTGISTTTIYLVPSDDPQSGNTYDEYINLNGTSAGWEKIGSTAIDLSGYYTSAETDALLDEKVDKDSFDEQTATDEFTTINGGLLSECKVALSPIQDLHGYLEPWVGGAGKNKVPFFTSSTVSGRVWTVSDDGIITITGTSTGNSYKVMNITLPAGTYQLSGGDPNGVSGTGDEYVQVDGVVVARSYGNTNQTFTLSEEKTVTLALRDFQTAGNSDTHVFKPMICLTSAVEPLVYEPYENICPITGHTQVVVGDDGKNLFDISTCIQNKYIDDDGTINNNNVFMYSLPMVVEPNEYYTFSGIYTSTGGANYRLLGYDKNDNFVSLLGKQGASVSSPSISISSQIPNNVKFVRVSLSKQSSNCQLEKGNQATAYVPYNGYQITVTLGGTYYSGTLDVVSGVFTPDTAIATVSDFAFTAGKSDGDLAKVEYTPSNFKNSIEKLKCNMMPYVEQSASWTETEPCYTIASGTKLRVYFDGDTLADFQRDFADIQIVYELATPTPIQLSPTMVKALIGENHLYAPLEGQEITEVKYKKMFTFDDVIAYIQSLS